MVAAHWGIASVLVYKVEEKLTKSYGQKSNDWETIRFSLSEALTLDPDNPDYLHKSGLAYENEFIYYPLGDASAENYRRKAYHYYTQSLNMRPVWPHHWIDLALVKYRLNELDDEFYQALEQAIALGPWEPWVQRTAADIGMHHWNKLPAHIQSLVKKTVRNGVRHRDSARLMLELVKRYDMFELVCDIELSDELTKKYCARRGYDGIDLHLDPLLR